MSKSDYIHHWPMSHITWCLIRSISSRDWEAREIAWSTNESSATAAEERARTMDGLHHRGTKERPPPPAVPPRKLTFSFDSSGWLYVYHLGVAQFLQRHLLPHLPRDSVAFSGSSGGALVAAALCTGIEIEELAAFVIGCHYECQFNPFHMLPCAEAALKKYLPPDAHILCENRLRVLLTRVSTKWPFVRPEAMTKFATKEVLAGALRASCHIPIFGGMRPYELTGAAGEALGAFYDGLFWPSVFFAWRAFDRSDTILKVSGIGWPTAHIRPALPMPMNWTMLPPSEKTLWRLYASGYDDAARFFERRTAKMKMNGKQVLPEPIPAQPRGWMLSTLIMLGWLHLVLITVLFPLVAPYLVCRQLWRRPRRGAFLTQLLKQTLIIAILLPLWPIVGVYLLCRWLLDSDAPSTSGADSLEDQRLDAALPPSLMQRVRLNSPRRKRPSSRGRGEALSPSATG